MLKHLRAGAPIIAGLLLLFIGIFLCGRFGWYYLIPNLDKVMHTAGGIIVAWFALSLMQGELTRMAAWKQALIIVSVVAFVGLAWEWAEYASNFTQHSYPLWYHYFHGGDLADTLGDLAADVAGGVLFALWAIRKERR
jgi:hypothetical protein